LPLMSARDPKSDKDSEQPELNEVLAENMANGEINELLVVAEGEEKITFFVWILIACSTISGLLFGA
jgi:MFS transporter, SP family, solute carrier family 2 (myo-inositol transporter), member 13